MAKLIIEEIEDGCYLVTLKSFIFTQRYAAFTKEQAIERVSYYVSRTEKEGRITIIWKPKSRK